MVRPTAGAIHPQSLHQLVELLRIERLRAVAIAVAITRKALELYRQSFVLVSLNSAAANGLAHRYLERFDQYDAACAREPERWMFCLSIEATKNCYFLDKHLGAVMDMTLLIGYFIKVLSGVIEASLLECGAQGAN
jgi:hypothetical protein